MEGLMLAAHKVRVILLNNEVWKYIPHTENSYLVSNRGRVLSVSRVNKQGVRMTSRLMRIQNSHGYGAVGVRVEGKQVYLKVHRLVASIFIYNPNNKPQVNHKNGVKSDNRVSNLEWVTPRENVLHAINTKLTKFPTGESHKGSLLKDEDVLFIRENHLKYKIKELAKMFNVHPANITAVLKNKTWRHLPLCLTYENKTKVGVINTYTGVYYESIKKAHESVGSTMSYTDFQQRLKGFRDNTTGFVLLNSKPKMSQSILGNGWRQGDSKSLL